MSLRDTIDYGLGWWEDNLMSLDERYKELYKEILFDIAYQAGREDMKSEILAILDTKISKTSDVSESGFNTP